MTAQRRLHEATSLAGDSSLRLSTGLRINRASDDAAGLSIATSLETRARIKTQGIRNINDGISLLNIADGALGALQSIVERQKELVEQAGSSIVGTQQRVALQAEFNQLRQESLRILETTRFNGRAIFSADGAQVTTLQADAGADSILNITIGSELPTTLVNTGVFTPSDTYSLINYNEGVNFVIGSFDEGSPLQMLYQGDFGIFSGSRLALLPINGDGTFSTHITLFTAGGSEFYRTDDVNGDGHLDVVSTVASDESMRVFLGAGNGTFSSVQSFRAYFDGTAVGESMRQFELLDIDGDGDRDVVTFARDASHLNVLLSNGDGTFSAARTQTVATGLFSPSIASGDFNGDGKGDIVFASTSSWETRLTIAISNGDGTFVPSELAAGAQLKKLAVGDTNGDGTLDIVAYHSNGTNTTTYLGNGNGTFSAPISIGAIGVNGFGPVDLEDVNGDGILDLIAFEDNAVRAFFGNGNGTFGAITTLAVKPDGLTERWFEFHDIDGNGTKDLIAMPHFGSPFISLGEGVAAFYAPDAHLMNRTEALTALEELDSYYQGLSLERSQIGAHLSRLTSVIRALDSDVLAEKAALGRIQDIDVSEESARYVNATIQQQTAAAVLAQANFQPRLALELLRF